MLESLKKQAVSSIKWQIISSLLQKILTFGVTIILARKLGPSNYGIFGLAMIVINAFALFKTLGIETALIQRKGKIKEAADTAFFIIPFLGIVIYCILFFSSPFLGRYLNNIELSKIIKMLGLSFVLFCFARVPLSLLEREMKFIKISIVEFFSAAIFAITAVTLAFNNFELWSLVYAFLAQSITSTILYFFFSKWKPEFRFNITIAFEICNFGKFIFLSGIVWFLRMNLDNFLVGKILGTTMLGLYAVAFNISNFIYDYFGMRLQRIFQPTYSKLQDDLPQLQNAFLKVVKHISLISLPFACGVFLLGGDFLKIAYGEKWVHAIGVLKILAFGCLFNTLPICNASVFLALGKQKLTFYYTLMQVLLFFIFIGPFAKMFQINGVGLVVTFAAFLSMLFSFQWALRLLSISPYLFLANLRVPFFASLFMGLFIYFMKMIPFFTNVNQTFIIFSIFSFCLYLLILEKLDGNILKEVKSILLNR